VIPISKDRLILVQTENDSRSLLAARLFEMSSPSCSLRDSIEIEGIRYVMLGTGEAGAAINNATLGELQKAALLPSHFWPRGVTLSLDDQKQILAALSQ
jgi:hypothetical protein